MKAHSKGSLPVFELTTFAALVLAGWAVYRLNELALSEGREGLIELRNEYTALSDSVSTNLAGLELTLTNAVKSKDPKASQHFQRQGHEWTGWLEARRRF